MIHREISDKKYQIDSLDGLRGFAALIVIFSHTSNTGMYFLPFLDLRGIGKSGVFLFFLLSSFLLTLPLLDKGKRILTLAVMSHYWQRRFFRIYPLYACYLLLAVVSTWSITTYFGKNGIGIPFDLDWHGLFEHLALQEGKGVTWSIAVEFKFYFILPMLALITVFCLSFGFGATILFFLALLALSQILFPQNVSDVNDAKLLPYMPIFLMGMLLAVIQNEINSKNGLSPRLKMIVRLLGYIGVLGILVMTPLVFSIFFGRISHNYFHKQFILYALFWSFVLLSAINVQGLIQQFFTLSVIRFYGALSFSLYLFHIIFISAVSRLELNEYLSAWLVLFVSTVSAYISFKLLEGPVSKFKISRSSLKSIFAYNKRIN